MNNILDTNNSELLDSSFDGQAYSYAGGVSSDQINAVVSGATQLAGTVQGMRNSPRANSRRENKSACGKRPLLTITKKQKAKRADWDKCVSAYTQSKNAAPVVAAPDNSTPTPASTYAKETSSIQDPTLVVEKKVLGMKPAVGYTVITLVGIGLIIGGVFLYKKMKNKGVSAPAAPSPAV